MIKVLGHDIRMTPAAEAHLVKEAKVGNKIAEKMLLEAYIDPVKTVHMYSAVGKFPARLCHNYNHKGLTFEEHGEPLAEINHRCIQLFDFEKKHKTAKLPYLKYLLDTIDHRALDYLEKEQLHASREVTINELQKAKKGDMNWESMSHDEFLNAVALRDQMHDNAAQEQKDAEVKRLYNKALNSKDITPGNRLYMQKYVEVARNKINGKGIMADTMKEMEMAAPKEAGKSKKGSKARTGGYHYERTAKAQLGKDFQDQFLAALSITGE